MYNHVYIYIYIHIYIYIYIYEWFPLIARGPRELGGQGVPLDLEAK